MLLAMDIGNTNTVLGLFREDRLIHDWRIRTEVNATIDEFAITLRSLFDIEGIPLSDSPSKRISPEVGSSKNNIGGSCRIAHPSARRCFHPPERVAVMGRAAPGMQVALRPEGRSGIWGRVLVGGRVRCGDEFELEAASQGP